jgi:UTRA domain
VRLDSGWERFHPLLPTGEQRQLLGLGARTPVLGIERPAYSNSVPVEWRHGIVRTDRWPAGPPQGRRRLRTVGRASKSRLTRTSKRSSRLLSQRPSARHGPLGSRQKSCPHRIAPIREPGWWSSSPDGWCSPRPTPSRRPPPTRCWSRPAWAPTSATWFPRARAGRGPPRRAQPCACSRSLLQLGYLPLRWTPASTTASSSPNLDAYNPPAGRFTWTWVNPPATLALQWAEGQYTTMTRGAVMAFESDQGSRPTGTPATTCGPTCSLPRQAPTHP